LIKAGAMAYEKMVKCIHPDCTTMIRYNRKSTGYCWQHTDWSESGKRIAEYNRQVKKKPEHLRYRTERIPSIPRICIVCGKQFLATPGAVKKGGGIVCSRKCQGVRAAKLTPKRDTAIEKAIEAVLRSRGVEYQKQVALCGVTLADFYLPQYRVVIFCDGEYWHQFPKRQRQDAIQNEVLGVKKYHVYRFTEQAIERSPEACVDTITELDTAPSLQLRLPIDV